MVRKEILLNPSHFPEIDLEKFPELTERSHSIAEILWKSMVKLQFALGFQDQAPAVSAL